MRYPEPGDWVRVPSGKPRVVIAVIDGLGFTAARPHTPGATVEFYEFKDIQLFIDKKVG